jgi:hypothetical protein
MPDNIQNALPLITGALFVLALLLFVLSLRYFRRSRTDVFWRRRREAGQRGWRALVSSFVMIVLSIGSCACTVLFAIIAEDEPAPVATEIGFSSSPLPTNQIETPVVTPPDTPTPIVVIITATPLSTPTVTTFPTFAPLVTPLVSNVTPLPGAEIRITALDDRISDNLTPVNPRAAFRAGTTRIYLFVEFTDMAQGVIWKRELYRDGELLDGGEYLWGHETEGSAYFFFGNDSGFPPGEYEIRLYIGTGSTPVSITPFTVVEVP